MRRLFAATVLFVSACGTTISYVPTNAPPRAMQPRPVATVEVFSVSMPERPFVEVGLIEAQQSSEVSLDAPPEVLQKLRADAAARGCDAIILAGANDAVVGGSVHGDGSVSTLRGYRATCIMYRPLPAGEVAAGSPAAP